MKKIILFTAAAFFASLANAATITWTTADITGDISEVLTTGTSIAAVNATSTQGVALNPTLTFAGTTFTSASVLARNYDNDVYQGTTSGGTAAENAAYDAFLSREDFALSGKLTIELSSATIGQDLVIGHDYVLQVWYCDVQSTRVHTITGVDDTNKGDNTLREGQFAIGTFTADESSQSFLYSPDSSGPRITGYQLRDVTVISKPLTLG